jgi:hypothetical protein
VRLGLAFGGIALVAVVGGCTSHAEGPSWTTPSGSAPAGSAPAAAGGSAPPFTEPASYTFVLTRGCDVASPLGRYKVTVKNGAVATSNRLDTASAAASPSASSDADLGPVTGQDGEEIEVPTLAGLISIAQTASDDGGEVTTTYDTTDGHPLKVVVNVSDAGPSGAECFNVSDYTPTP